MTTGLACVAALVGVVVVLFVIALGGVVTAGGRTHSYGAPGVVCAPAGVDPADLVDGFGPAQVSNAAHIVAVGVEMGVPVRGQVVAVATAMQESTLLNYANHTVAESLTRPHEAVGADHDSVGLFQQRAAGWGPVALRMDPRGSARLFYERLLQIPGWETMPLTRSAQSVQISAFPAAYAKWEHPAVLLVGALDNITCTGPAPGSPPGAGPVLPGAVAPHIRQVIDRALTQQGQPYVWAGGDAHGPTKGGFDCSGLMTYAFAGIGIDVPHQTQAIWQRFQPAITDPAQVQPGDMLLFTSNGRPGGIHHVGLYLGNNRMLHAPQTGDVVKTEPDIWNNTYYAREFIGAVRATHHPAT
ncbi:C40 family peptidase [Pseudonocardia sp. ICBG1293]|uniref:C40 family peptidase n=1 Tax=Pseudonocardia sp. ICBG1293 TaxID=2844382 RepID=UPI001CCF884A|nr:C40 family peptidase [Pseudonocardia sp. ICBG1293]